jgi:hypothetical protein
MSISFGELQAAISVFQDGDAALTIGISPVRLRLGENMSVGLACD